MWKTLPRAHLLGQGSVVTGRVQGCLRLGLRKGWKHCQNQTSPLRGRQERELQVGQKFWFENEVPLLGMY
jgi:hypothetical protein